MFNFCSSGSGWKKNTGKTLLRICKKPKIFWANIKSRQSCSRILEEDSGITTSHLCRLSHTATTQQRPNRRRLIFLLSTFENHLAIISIPSSRLSSNHANSWFVESFLMKILHYVCVCVYECVSHSFIIWAGSSSLDMIQFLWLSQFVSQPQLLSPYTHIAWHLLWG